MSRVRVEVGSLWDDAYGRRHQVHAINGEGLSVSTNPEIAQAQRAGPPMVLLTREGQEPHIFDWLGEPVLRRDFVEVPRIDPGAGLLAAWRGGGADQGEG